MVVLLSCICMAIVFFIAQAQDSAICNSCHSISRPSSFDFVLSSFHLLCFPSCLLPSICWTGSICVSCCLDHCCISIGSVLTFGWHRSVALAAFLFSLWIRYVLLLYPVTNNSNNVTFPSSAARSTFYLKYKSILFLKHKSFFNSNTLQISVLPTPL